MMRPVELVQAGKAYVCDLTAEQTREYRGTLTEPGTPSPYRDRSVEENLDLLSRMRAGEFEDGARVLRAKIDMASPNMNMRDPTLYRIRHGVIHHQTGEAWCIYPMYDFTHPFPMRLKGSRIHSVRSSLPTTARCTTGCSRMSRTVPSTADRIFPAES